MRRAGELTDEQLLASGSPEAMGMFYDRTVEGLLGYFARRTRNPEVAADLTAETYAAAIVARARFRGDGRPPPRGCSRSPTASWPTTIGAASPRTGCVGACRSSARR
jgi:hypothetical protein